MAWNTFPLRLEYSEHITPSILHLAFRRADGERFNYIPGQFLNIHFEADGAPTHRSYSVANPPDDTGLIEIDMSPVAGGRATRLLSDLGGGDVVNASGPYGRFILRDDRPCRYVLAGTGTGITPFRAMLPELRGRIRAGFQADLLLGVWNPDELLYGAQFLEVAREEEGFRFHACYSRVMPEKPAPHERRGYVQSRFDGLGLDPESDIVYLCGNPNMVDDAMAYLRAAGFPSKHLRREKYVSART